MDKKTRHREYMRAYYYRPGKAAKSMQRIRRRQELMKVWFRQYKSTLPPCACGESDPICLDFHHIDPSTKTTPRGGISQVIFQNWSIKHILEEISKCGVICANCHRCEHVSSPKNVGIMQRKEVPSDEELAKMSKSCRHYWKHQNEMINRKNARIRELVEWYQSMKEETGCSRCPEHRYPCLDYHHRNQTTKIGRLAEMVYRGLSRDKLLAEIAKCDLLCANCHRKHHAQEVEVLQTTIEE